MGQRKRRQPNTRTRDALSVGRPANRKTHVWRSKGVLSKSRALAPFQPICLGRLMCLQKVKGHELPLRYANGFVLARTKRAHKTGEGKAKPLDLDREKFHRQMFYAS